MEARTLLIKNDHYEEMLQKGRQNPETPSHNFGMPSVQTDADFPAAPEARTTAMVRRSSTSRPLFAGYERTESVISLEEIANGKIK
ncbi:hypothetical protein Tco_0316652 [Tanacetum coccineum]